MTSGTQRLEKLGHLVLDLNVRWQMFDELYSDAKHYEVFNRTGPAFWSHLWYILLDDLFASISRFFDPAQSQTQDNFSLAAILEFPEVAAIRSNLQTRLDAMRPVWERGIKVWRHKKLSHSDMLTVLGTNRLPDIPLSEVKELVEKITDFTREIEHQLHQCDVSYSCSLTGWVPQVLSYLELGIERKDQKLNQLKDRINQLEKK
jgi:hypothetical protein